MYVLYIHTHTDTSCLRGEPLAEKLVHAYVLSVAVAEEKGESWVLVLDVHERDSASLRGGARHPPTTGARHPPITPTI
jgi:hypothetical protein